MASQIQKGKVKAMTFKWFKDCKTAEQGKDLYRKLAKQYHPDNGGTGEELKEIISEFKVWFNAHKDIHTDKNGNTYTSKKATTETPEDFIEIVNNLSAIPNIEVELCGSWIWITGNTFPYKDQLKGFGCRWSVQKKRWYWTQDPYRKIKSHASMDYIRSVYGSEKVELNRRPELQ